MLVNKIAQSGLIVLDLEDYYPKGGIVEFDISNYLFRGLILKEKEFREAMNALDLEQFRDRHVALWCSTDAIVPQWAYMLVTSRLINIAASISFGPSTQVEEKLLLDQLNQINIDAYRDERVIIKGCGKLDKSGSAYVQITQLLQPVVRSLMFGEPCSTVPVFKRK